MKNLIFNLCLTLVLLAGAQSVNAQSRSLFVTDAIYGIIYEFTNGLASAQGTFAAGLSSPIGLAFDKAGNLFLMLHQLQWNIFQHHNLNRSLRR